MFTFNGDYKDLEQVAAFYPAYEAVYNEIKAADKYPYNDSFKGKIKRLEADDKNEDTAIYLLQQTRHEKQRQANIDELLAEGFKRMGAKPESEGKYSEIVQVGTDYSIHSIKRYPQARIKVAGNNFYILPKGARTRGYVIWPGRAVFAK